MAATVRVGQDKLLSLTTSALAAVGVPLVDAEIAAGILVTADLQGIDTHGTRRLAPYLARIRDGVFNPRPNIRLEQTGTSAAIVEGDNGLGPVVGCRGLELALRLAKESGTAYVGCRNSQHFGALAPYALRAAEAGVLCFLGTNAFTTMAPWGGRDIRVGNNPLGLGAPRRNAPPFILDIAMSVAARGKMRKAAEKGEPIPEGWALDADGSPTTDPEKGLAGYVLPIGGHKGYGLALMVDVLAGALSGGAVSTEVNSLFQQRDRPQRVSHFFIAIDPAKTIGTEAYLDRIETLCALMKTTEPFDAESPVLVPGEIEAQRMQERCEAGIPMESELLESIRGLARGEAPKSVAAA